MEHPAFPVWAIGRERARAPPASVWALRVVRALTRLACVQVVTTDQCLFGSLARKPTTLLVGRLAPLVRHIMRTGAAGRCTHERWEHKLISHRLQRGVIVVDSSYPADLSKRFGDALFDFAVLLHKRRGEALQVEAELDEVPEALLASGVHCDARVLEEVAVQRDFLV